MYAPFVPAVAAAMAEARRRIEATPSPASMQKGRPLPGPPPANSNVAPAYFPAAVSAVMSSGTAAL